MIRLFFSVVLLGFLATSCTITQTYSFRPDQSGTYEFSMDLSAMAALAGGEEGADSDAMMRELMTEINVDSIETSLNSNPGISKAAVKEKDGILTVQYDFSDIVALNRSLEGSDMASVLGSKSNAASGANPKFDVKGKTWKYSVPGMDKLENAEDLGELESMAGMIQFDLIFNFPKKVKKVKNDNATISANGKTVTINTTLDALSAPGATPLNTEFKF